MMKKTIIEIIRLWDEYVSFRREVEKPFFDEDTDTSFQGFINWLRFGGFNPKD